MAFEVRIVAALGSGVCTSVGFSGCWQSFLNSKLVIQVYSLCPNSWNEHTYTSLCIYFEVKFYQVANDIF